MPQQEQSQPANGTASPQTEGQSPLAEASPSSLDEIFSRDPEGLQERDIVAAVSALRAKREDWMKAEAAGARSAPRASGPKLAPSHGPAPNPDDLGI